MRFFNYILCAVLLSGIALSSCGDKDVEDAPIIDPVEPIDPVDPVEPFVGSRETDSLALVTLYNACEGTEWHDTWDLKLPIDEWYGVSMEGGRVYDVELYYNNLKGQLPEELTKLDKMERFHANGNALTGELPKWLAQMPMLRRIRLDDNYFTGTIPSEYVAFANKPNNRLELQENFIESPIPNGMALDNDSDIIYRYQYLPEDTNKENETIDIARELYAMPCNVTDSLALVELCNANPALEELWDLNSPIHNWQGVSLQIKDNTLVVIGLLCDYINDFPKACEDLNHLRKLDLRRYSFTSFPASILELRNLEYLELNGEGVKAIPAGIDKLSKLEYLEIADYTVESTIPSTLFNLTELNYLSFFGCNLVGELPQELGQLSKLRYLDLDENSLSGTIPTSIGSLKQLETVYLCNNEFTGIIPESIGELSSLCYLFMQENRLSGTIPASLANITHLTYLILGDNEITGTIPPEIGSLTYLEELNLSNCLIDGEIPTTFMNLKALYSLDLSYTNLSGKLPSFLATLSKLNDVYLNCAYFTGTIPASYAGTNWEVMNLEYNFLTAPVPEGLKGNYAKQYLPYDVNKTGPTYDITTSATSTLSCRTHTTRTSKDEKKEVRKAATKRAIQAKFKQQYAL
ncbi:MAG: leucine-rich repeat domain-containing protein [Marinifilaceae bacterium]